MLTTERQVNGVLCFTVCHVILNLSVGLDKDQMSSWIAAERYSCFRGYVWPCDSLCALGL